VLYNRFLVLFSWGAIVVACADGTAPESDLSRSRVALVRAATSEHETSAFDFSIPLYLGCLDEEVVWSGTVVYEDHIVTRPDGSTLLSGSASLEPGSTLVGPSGTWNAPRVVSHYTFVGDNAQINEKITWTNVATGARMVVNFKYHLVVAGNGDIKREIFVAHECTLKR
jgi:hypothetical protein